jgi:hypothetical protein
MPGGEEAVWYWVFVSKELIICKHSIEDKGRIKINMKHKIVQKQ